MLVSYFFYSLFFLLEYSSTGRKEEMNKILNWCKDPLTPSVFSVRHAMCHCRDPDDDASVDTVSWTRCGISSSVLQARRRWSGTRPYHGGCGIWPLGTLVTRRHNPLLLLFLRAAEAVVLRNWRHRSTEVVSFVADRQDKCRPRCRCTNYSWLFLWPSLHWRGPGRWGGVVGRGRGCLEGRGRRGVGVRKSRKNGVGRE